MMNNPDKVIALVGNPNSGKTTLFNKLTGTKQRVGNWPGVTVEKKDGSFCVAHHQICVVDLPGIYSLSGTDESLTIDEKITCDYIVSDQADLLINIIDAANLERHLYLTIQLIELGKPLLVVLNRMDIVEKQGGCINIDKLSAVLGCPVLALQAHKKQNMLLLKEMMGCEKIFSSCLKRNQIVKYPPVIEAAIQQLSANLSGPHKKWQALKQLEIQHEFEQEADVMIADARYSFINQLTRDAYYQSGTQRYQLTQRLDKIILHRFWGLPLFFFIMYTLFVFSINMGGAFQEFFDIASDAIFVQGLTKLLTQWHCPDWITVILASGLGKGMNTTITFVPIIGTMFLFLSFLEDSGYMVRAAFVMDRVMRSLGLPGKSFVPLMVGFGCNVPAIMSSRILENQRDRILTIIMTPFMSCGARLAIFTVFTAAFFPNGSAYIVFTLYFIGVLAAVLTGLILRKTLLKGDPMPLVMELPLYHVPPIKSLLLHTWHRLKGFLWRAGQIIVPICMLIGVLNSIPLHNDRTILAALGQTLTPLFAPMGLQSNNWPATVGLLTGILAKEVVVGTLNTLYTEIGNLVVVSSSEFNFWGSMQAACATIPANLAALSHAFANPILAQAKTAVLTNGIFGQMYQRFDGQTGAFAYLLFILLYVPCVSTLAVIMRELNKKWMLLSLLWNTSFAYGVAVIFYQIATFSRHPVDALSWIMGILIFNLILVLLLHYFSVNKINPL